MKIVKKIAKWLLLVLMAIGIIVTGLWALNSPEELSENSESKSWLERGEYSVTKIDLDIIDSSRVTPAMGDFKGSDKRVLNGAIWLPKGNSEDQLAAFPLIIYSHGFGGHHKDSTHIATYLARDGYIVAAVNFPLSTSRSPAGIPQLLDVVNQPEDVSAVIDHILLLNNDPNSTLHNRIDQTRIGAMGLSLGGLTTALVTFHPDLKDDRIKAVVMMAPSIEAFSDRFYASNRSVHSLLLSGSMDRVIPEPANATEVRVRHPNGWFMSMHKGTHLGFADVGNPTRWMENPDHLGCAFMDWMLPKLDLPARWDAVIPNTGGVLRDIEVGQPCPDLDGQSMNGLKQQWLTRIAIGAFFDMYLQSGVRAESANEFFSGKFLSENSELSLSPPL